MGPSTFGKNVTKVKSENVFVQFAEWARTWNKNEKQIEFVPLDMPEIVVVLQSLGFRIERIDGCPPEEIAPVSEGGQGIRISVTCGHSGQRCILELETQPHECDCAKVSGDLGEEFWEVTATVPKNNQSSSFVESGSALIPSIPKDLSILIRRVLNYFAHIIQSKTDSNQNMDCSPNLNKIKEAETSLQSIADSVPLATSSTTDLRFGNNDVVNKKLCLNVPPSPTRYRSLDTLTSNNAPSELPEPGALTKITTPHRKVRNPITQSSPNIKLAAELRGDPAENNSSENKDYEDVKKLLRNSAELINQALGLIEQKTKKSVSPEIKIKKPSPREKNVVIKKFFETTLHRPSSVLPKVKQTYGSSPVLTKKLNRNDKTPSHTSFTHSSSNRIIRPPSTSSMPSPRSPIKKTSSSSASKIPGSGNRLVKKPNNSLYGHVKSTIPKPTPAKKEINK